MIAVLGWLRTCGVANGVGFVVSSGALPSSAIGLTKVSLASSDLSAACGSAKPVGRSFSKFSALEKRVDKSSSTLAVGVFAADLTRSAKLRFLEVIDQPFTENIFRNSRVKAFTSSIAREDRKSVV